MDADRVGQIQIRKLRRVDRDVVAVEADNDLILGGINPLDVANVTVEITALDFRFTVRRRIDPLLDLSVQLSRAGNNALLAKRTKHLNLVQTFRLHCRHELIDDDITRLTLDLHAALLVACGKILGGVNVKKLKVVVVGQLGNALLNQSRIGDDRIGSCLTVDHVEPHRWDTLTIQQFKQYISRADGRKLFGVADQNQLCVCGDSIQQKPTNMTIYHRGFIYNNDFRIKRFIRPHIVSADFQSRMDS